MMYRNPKVFGLNRIALINSDGVEMSCEELKLSLKNCKLMDGNLSHVFVKENGTPNLLKISGEENAGIKASFMSGSTLAEIRVQNYKGEQSKTYGIKGLTIMVNSISVFAGELTLRDSDDEKEISLRLFVNQAEQQMSVKKKTNMVYIKKDMNRTSMINSPPPDFPTLVKHKSQDISLSSQQSEGSTSRVI